MKNNIFNGTSQTINQTNSNNIEMKSCPINNTFKIVGKKFSVNSKKYDKR
jgi:hypothetical protein